MRHLACRVTQTDTLVEGRGPEPRFAAFVKFGPLPKTHVVTLARTVPHRQLEGQILFACEQIQTAHRRLVIGPARHRIDHDARACRECDRVRGIPTSRRHRAHHFLFRALQCDVDRIPRMPVQRVRHARAAREARFIAVKNPPHGRCSQIGGHRPCENNRDYDNPHVPPFALGSFFHETKLTLAQKNTKSTEGNLRRP